MRRSHRGRGTTPAPGRVADDETAAVAAVSLLTEEVEPPRSHHRSPAAAELAALIQFAKKADVPLLNWCRHAAILA